MRKYNLLVRGVYTLKVSTIIQSSLLFLSTLVVFIGFSHQVLGRSMVSAQQSIPLIQLPVSLPNVHSLPKHVLLNVPAVNQWPELPNGCEVTSLSMLLQFEGIDVNNTTLANEIARAHTPRKIVHGVTVQWGDPNDGFVGSMRDFDDGYGVFNGPIDALAQKYLGADVDDQTGRSSKTLWEDLATGRPVEVWTNVWFEHLPSYDWMTWQSDHGPVRATMEEHAVVLVGYSKHEVYINNPENGDKDEAVARGPFLASWRQMGRQTITVKDPILHGLT